MIHSVLQELPSPLRARMEVSPSNYLSISRCALFRRLNGAIGRNAAQAALSLFQWME